MQFFHYLMIKLEKRKKRDKSGIYFLLIDIEQLMEIRDENTNREISQ